MFQYFKEFQRFPVTISQFSPKKNSNSSFSAILEVTDLYSSVLILLFSFDSSTNLAVSENHYFFILLFSVIKVSLLFMHRFTIHLSITLLIMNATILELLTHKPLAHGNPRIKS